MREMHLAVAQKLKGARLAVAESQAVAGMAKTEVYLVEGLIASVLRVGAVRVVDSYLLLALETRANSISISAVSYWSSRSLEMAISTDARMCSSVSKALPGLGKAFCRGT